MAVCSTLYRSRRGEQFSFDMNTLPDWSVPPRIYKFLAGDLRDEVDYLRASGANVQTAFNRLDELAPKWTPPPTKSVIPPPPPPPTPECQNCPICGARRSSPDSTPSLSPTPSSLSLSTTLSISSDVTSASSLPSESSPEKKLPSKTWAPNIISTGPPATLNPEKSSPTNLYSTVYSSKYINEIEDISKKGVPRLVGAVKKLRQTMIYQRRRGEITVGEYILLAEWLSEQEVVVENFRVRAEDDAYFACIPQGYIGWSETMRINI